MIRLASLSLPLMLMIGVACSDPLVSEYEARTGIITGTILYPGGTSRGNVIVLLFREDMLPPPQGTSRPVNFIVVPKESIFGDSPAGVAGDFAAPYTMPTVLPGRYQIRAFLDADDNFNPVFDLLGQPTAGDVGGGHIDLETRSFLPVEVQLDKTTPQVTVTLGLTYPLERPAFAFTSSTTYRVPYARPQLMTVAAHPLMRGQVQMDPTKTAFLIQYADLDGDGRVDDANGDHLPDLFPQVILRRRPTADMPETIVIPGIIDPFPYLDALTAVGSAVTTRLDILLPPVSVEVAADGSRTIRPSVPPGTYDTILISGTGQTWQVPNAMDSLLPSETDTTQSEEIVMEAGDPLPSGRIEGVVRVANDRRGDAYVIAFDATNPPPPVGTGRPVALASVPEAAFMPSGSAMAEATFAILGLSDGNYIVRGFVDIDRNFSPLQDLIAQPSARDFGGGSAPPVVTVAGGGSAGAVVELSTPVGFDRPSFEFDAVQIPRTGFPAVIELRSHPVPVLGSTEASTLIPVVLGTADEDGDNYRDLLPRVLLTKIAGAGEDPRGLPDESPAIVIPGIVDPLSFTGVLSMGVPAVPSSSLRVILPPVAFKLLGPAPTQRELISPPPAGRYRVNVLSATGQTWSVPSNLDLVLKRAGTELEDQTQARVVEVKEAAIPGGAITGMINLLAMPPPGDYQVIVFAFDKNNPPPPAGAGRPMAVAVIPKTSFGAGSNAAYALRGLPAGTYTVRAFLDANDNFTAWYDVKNQPDAGDWGGGHIAIPAGTFLDVQVMGIGAPAANIDVSVLPQAAFTTDRPMFTVSSTAAVMNPAEGPLVVTLEAASAQSDVLQQEGVFPIQWVDLDQNGVAEDRNGDMNPDTFPLVVAQLLDPDDDTHQTLDTSGIRIPGFVNPGQFATAGFPAADPTATGTVTPVTTMIVAFAPIAVDAGGQRIAPPDGNYRITLINGRGQTWSIPNELTRAQGTTLPVSQSKRLEVRR